MYTYIAYIHNMHTNMHTNKNVSRTHIQTHTLMHACIHLHTHTHAPVDRDQPISTEPKRDSYAHTPPPPGIARSDTAESEIQFVDGDAECARRAAADCTTCIPHINGHIRIRMRIYAHIRTQSAPGPRLHYRLLTLRPGAY